MPIHSHAGYVPGVVEIRGHIAINRTTRYVMMPIYLLKEKEGTRWFVCMPARSLVRIRLNLVRCVIMSIHCLYDIPKQKKVRSYGQNTHK